MLATFYYVLSNFVCTISVESKKADFGTYGEWRIEHELGGSERKPGEKGDQQDFLKLSQLDEGPNGNTLEWQFCKT